MRMQNLLSKSKNIHHYEAASEGKWMTVEDAIDRAKDPSSILHQEKAHLVDPMDPMDPAFDPRVLALNVKHRRHKDKRYAPAAAVKQQLRKGPALESMLPVLSVSSGSSAGSGSGSETSSSSEGSASESGSGSESGNESSYNRSDDDDADGSG